MPHILYFGSIVNLLQSSYCFRKSTSFRQESASMKSKEANLANANFPKTTPMQKKPSLKGDSHISARTLYADESTIWTRRWHLAGLLAAGYFTLTPLTLAHGNSGGHMSGMGSLGNAQHNEHCRYSNPFPGPWYDYHAGIYDPVYSYTPTPEQQAMAKQQVESYLLGVKKRRYLAASHRYISVETLRPTKKQLEDFVRKQPPTRRVEPAKLRCLMVFDTQTQEFVGARCYVVSTAPLAGEVAKFETVSAEFVGHENL
jgi:hypothetical protein